MFFTIITLVFTCVHVYTSTIFHAVSICFSVVRYFNALLSCCTLPVISKHKPLALFLLCCLLLEGFLLPLGAGFRNTGCSLRFGLGLILFTSLSSDGRRSILFSDSSSETSSSLSRTYKSINKYRMLEMKIKGRPGGERVNVNM